MPGGSPRNHDGGETGYLGNGNTAGLSCRVPDRIFFVPAGCTSGARGRAPGACALEQWNRYCLHEVFACERALADISEKALLISDRP
jgi:hypothetical protein